MPCNYRPADRMHLWQKKMLPNREKCNRFGWVLYLRVSARYPWSWFVRQVLRCPRLRYTTPYRWSCRGSFFFPNGIQCPADIVVVIISRLIDRTCRRSVKPPTFEGIARSVWLRGGKRQCSAVVLGLRAWCTRSSVCVITDRIRIATPYCIECRVLIEFIGVAAVIGCRRCPGVGRPPLEGITDLCRLDRRNRIIPSRAFGFGGRRATSAVRVVAHGVHRPVVVNRFRSACF